MRQISLLLVAFVPLSSCADHDSPPPSVERVGATHDFIPLGACQRDTALLSIIRSADFTCSICRDGLTELVDEACVLDACELTQDLEGTVCRPDLDYRCEGEVRVASATCTGVVGGPASLDCCPARFRYMNDGFCQGSNPQRCRADGDCPDGTYCSAERGGVCWFDCVPTTVQPNNVRAASPTRPFQEGTEEVARVAAAEREAKGPSA